MNYMIYVKTAEMKRARPISRKGVAYNLIYALMYETYQDATHDMKKLQEINPGVTFEVRKRRNS